MSTGPADFPKRPIWLKLLIAAALLVALLNAGAYVYGLTLPDEWHVEESVVVVASPEDVYPLVASPKRWPEWASWNKTRDATVEFSFEGPDSDKGAAFSWQGEQLGIGKLTIIEAEPNASVSYVLSLGGAEFSENGRIALTAAEGGTRVTWTDGGELGGTLGRLFRGRLEQSVSADFAASLENLKSIAERPRSEAQPQRESDSSP